MTILLSPEMVASKVKEVIMNTALKATGNMYKLGKIHHVFRCGGDCGGRGDGCGGGQAATMVGRDGAGHAVRPLSGGIYGVN